MPLIEQSTTRNEGGVEFGGGRQACAPGEATVADAMVGRPKLLPVTATGRDVRELFLDDHVHAGLVVDGDRLLAVIERQDLAEVRDDEPATALGTLSGRTVGPQADLWSTWTWMTGAGIRRLAVVEDGRCVGLLCLKRSGRGFCCDAGVWARARERSTSRRCPPEP
ncbi:CBS domain-containing protein [Nocardioides sp. NPDC047086]|uniref:CBS domain-containing protein n=1 Tax=Nocardioides sp. NPDC047086 TaxID=3154810 RepID=UPI00340AB6BA